MSGDSDSTLVHLEEAEYALEGAGCVPWAVAAHRRAEFMRHDREAGVAAADARLRGFGIHAPDRMSRVLVPGFGPIEAG